MRGFKEREFVNIKPQNDFVSFFVSVFGRLLMRVCSLGVYVCFVCSVCFCVWHMYSRYLQRAN